MMSTPGPSLAPPGAAAAPDEIELAERIDRALAREGRFAWLDPVLVKLYEQDTRAQRVGHLRLMIVLGLVIYNVYALTGFVTLPSLGWANMALRLGVVTPGALGIIWLIPRLGHVAREALAAAGVATACAVPILMFALSPASLGPFMTVEIVLTLAYASTTLAIRPPWAITLLVSSLVAASAILLTKRGLDPPLAAVIWINLFTGAFYGLVANLRIHHGDWRNFLLMTQESVHRRRLELSHSMLERLSNTDALTALANRHALAAELPRLDREIGQGRAMAVLLADVDYFKRFNDHYGHGEGDTCLQAVAGALRAELPAAQDMVVRWGGEEFLFILPDRTPEEALAIGEQLRLAVAALALAHEDRSDALRHVTLSIGVATTLAGRVMSLARLIQAADEALYDAKAMGRDQVRPFRGLQTPRPARHRRATDTSFDRQTQASA